MTRQNIEKLNRAGLEYLQISIDNVKPDKTSQKSLKVIDRYLGYLSQYAKFHVNINSVIGGGVKNPEDALVVAERAVELGFGSTLGIIHDGNGQLKPLSGVEEEVYKKLRRYGKKKFGWLNQFQDDVAYGRPHNWRCRAGARYLYICEDGLVHYCSQQRGFPASRSRNTRASTSNTSSTPKTLREILHHRLRPAGGYARQLARASTSF